MIIGCNIMLKIIGPCILVCLLVSCSVNSLAAEHGPVLTLEQAPGWRGQPRGATCGLSADVNGDGAPDLISIRNIGDHVIYFNTGSGLPLNPGWRVQGQSDVFTYCVIAADLQNDGYPEVILFRDNMSHSQQACEVYPNTSGIPGTEPVWYSQVHFSYGGDAGDVDGDGIPDLYVPVYDGPDVLYRGQASGTFSDLPVWTAGDDAGGVDVDLVDIDADGDLDAVVCTAGDSPLRIHANVDGTLSQLPAWECSTDITSLMVTAADADGDGYPEVAVGSWTSPSVIYQNQGGELDPDPVWTALPDASILDTYYWSTLEWADVNGDGFPEIAMGNRWWTPSGAGGDYLRVFLNTGGAVSETPVWSSATERPVHELGFSDLFREGYPDLWAIVEDAPEVYMNTLDTWGGLGVSIWMPSRRFSPGETFSMHLNIMNPWEPLLQTPVFVVLECTGAFWCAPGWTDLFSEMDYFTLDIPVGSSRLEVVPPMPWPEIQGSMDGLCIYAAMTDPSMTEILGNLDLWYFGYHP